MCGHLLRFLRRRFVHFQQFRAMMRPPQAQFFWRVAERMSKIYLSTQQNHLKIYFAQF